MSAEETDYRERRKKGGNPPDYVLRAIPKDNPDNTGWCTVGAAWDKDNGISISLNTGVTLRWDDGLRFFLIANDKGR